MGLRMWIWTHIDLYGQTTQTHPSAHGYWLHREMKTKNVYVECIWFCVCACVCVRTCTRNCQSVFVSVLCAHLCLSV